MMKPVKAGPKKPVRRDGSMHPDKVADAKKKTKMASAPSAKSKPSPAKQKSPLYGEAAAKARYKNTGRV